jgi:hypothetical protein
MWKMDGVTSGLNYEKENGIYGKGNSGGSIILRMLIV